MSRSATAGILQLAIVGLTAVIAPPTLASAQAGSPREFRLVTYDFKHRTEDTLSYASYHAALESQLLAAAAEFSGEVPTLALMPENSGLMAWLVGARGATARALADTGAPDSSAAAIAALAPGYATAVAYYQTKCPGISPVRALILALTDTAWRALIEEVVRLAGEHGLWVLTSLNTPDVTVTRDPVTVALLADPDLVASSYAYEGGCEAFNVAMLVAPTAALEADGAADPTNVASGVQKKIYLVPIERAQDVGLTLSSESPANARAITTPFARIGVLTSKDAWMPDVAERLEVDGMDLFVQPEAGAWAGRGSGLPDWPPDAMARAIWAMVQQHAETTHGALPNLTGNFGDQYFDGTATITRDAVAGEIPTEYLLGRPPQPGIVARALWVFADPPPAVPLADVAARRQFLDSNGAKLLPGSGDVLENGQLSGFVATNVSLASVAPSGARITGPPASSVAVAPTGMEQWSPALASDADGALLLAAWTDLRDAHEQPYVARSTDGGLSWSTAVRAGDAVFREFDQQDNQYDARIVRAADGTLHLVWIDFRNQSWDVYASRSSDAGLTWSASTRVDASPSSAEGFPNENLHQDPSLVALADGTLVAAWADARGMRTDHGIRAARSTDGGASWSGDASVDGADAIDEAEQWAPVLAVTDDGQLVAAWQDHRDGINQIYLARSNDQGTTWSEALRLAPGSADQWQPAVAAGRRGRVVVAWSEASGDGGRRIKTARINRRGRVRIASPDTSSPAGVRQARPAVALVKGRKPWVAWQDDRAGDWDVLLARVRNRDSKRKPQRVDDGPADSHARLPVLQGIGRRLLAAWEDTRTGIAQIRAARVR